MLGLNERNGEGGNVPVCVCECLHARVCKGACEYIRESLLKGCLYVCVSERERERRGGGLVTSRWLSIMATLRWHGWVRSPRFLKIWRSKRGCRDGWLVVNENFIEVANVIKLFPPKPDILGKYFKSWLKIAIFLYALLGEVINWKQYMADLYCGNLQHI